MPYQALSGKPLLPGQLASRITDWLVQTPTAQEAMTQGLVTALERSGTCDRTRRPVALLEKLPRSNPQQLEQISQAAATNDKVTAANLDGKSVPKVLSELIIRHGGRAPVADFGERSSDRAPF